MLAFIATLCGRCLSTPAALSTSEMVVRGLRDRVVKHMSLLLLSRVALTMAMTVYRSPANVATARRRARTRAAGVRALSSGR